MTRPEKNKRKHDPIALWVMVAIIFVVICIAIYGP